jgi:hypothetical protein
MRWMSSAIWIAAAVALTGLYVLSAGGGFPLDDSWIHQTYGRNLGTLGEFAFYPGTPSAASTSPLYTVILAAGYALRIDYRLWTHGVGAAALAALTMIAVWIATRLTTHRWITWAVGAALVSAWHLIWAAASGMETAVFAALALGMIGYTGLKDRLVDTPIRYGAGFGVLSGLTVLARPEGMLIAVLCGAALVLSNAHRRQRAVALLLIAAGVAFGLVVAPYVINNVSVTGGLLPNTAGAKRAQAAALFALPYTERLARLIIPLLAGGQVMLIPGIIAFVAKTFTRWQASRWLLIAWGGGLIALYAAYLPLDIQHGRYVIPALPALIVMGVIGTGELWEWVKPRRNPAVRAMVRALIISAAVLFVLFALTLGRAAYVQDVQIIDGDMVAAAVWINANIPTDELLAIHDIGAVGYFAPRRMLDIGGLVSPEVIPIIRDGDAIWELLETRNAAYLMAYDYQTPNENPNDARLCPLYTSGNQATEAAGGAPMRVYRIDANGACDRATVENDPSLLLMQNEIVTRGKMWFIQR